MTITYQHSAHRGIEKPLTMYKKTILKKAEASVSVLRSVCDINYFLFFKYTHTYRSMEGTSRAFVVTSHGCAPTFRVKVPSHTHRRENPPSYTEL